MTFKSTKEIYEHLLKDGKVKNTAGDIVYLKENGCLSEGWVFNMPEYWSPVQEPKVIYVNEYDNYAYGYYSEKEATLGKGSNCKRVAVPYKEII